MSGIGEQIGGQIGEKTDEEIGGETGCREGARAEGNRGQECALDFCLLAEHLYDGIHLTDGQGKVIYINAAYTRTTGILPEQVVGRFVRDIEAEGRLYKGSVTEEVIQTRKRVNSVAWIYGLEKEVLVTGTPVFDEDGTLCYVVTNTRDFGGLNELKEQLDALRRESGKDKEELAFLRRQQIKGREIMCHSECMKKVRELVKTVAATDVTVLITGESGTGKEVVADEIYRSSNRCDKPFIKVNCAAIPSELLESELFGYEGGAFTDARRRGKAGMFELANGGVILLDEIGDMPFSLQTKLLRVLQEREIMRIGGTKNIKLNIRVIASTNRDLRREIREKRFREDLYYRLNVVPIHLNPLRERKEEIPYLTLEFLHTFEKRHNKRVSIERDAMRALTEYDWPGNIRELENVIERLVVTDTAGSIDRGMVLSTLNLTPLQRMESDQQGEAAGLKDCLRRYERELIMEALKKYGSKRRAAKALRIDHSTLVKKCQNYGISAEDEAEMQWVKRFTPKRGDVEW